MTSDAAALAGLKRILVIKLSALGDFVLALGPFAAIRKAHPDAHITLLTTKPYAELARASGYFDDVWIDSRAGLLRPATWLSLRRRLREGNFDRVYDFQTGDRTAWYFRLMGPGPRPQWSGIARGCSHPHDDPNRNSLHTIERQIGQLAAAGIPDVPDPDLSWMDADIAPFGLRSPFVLLIPGGAPHRPRKRWPADHFARLARDLTGRGLQPVVLGAAAERDAAATILKECGDAVSLVERTNLMDIAALARVAAGAVGNDTGPMHLVAAVGCPSLVLFSDESDPKLTAPRGADVATLRRPDLADLPVAEVAAAVRLR